MRLITVIPLLILLSGCIEKEPFNPNFHIPSSEELINMVDYQIMGIDCVNIYTTEEAYFDKKHFSKIVIFQLENFVELTPLDTIIPVYYKENDVYKLEINTSLIVPENQATYDLDIRFFLNEFDYRIVNLTIPLYKYPFNSSTLLFNFGQYFPGSGFIQGFETYNGNLYFRLSGPESIYKYSLNRKTNEEVFGPLPSGDWFSIYEDTLYVDRSHTDIIKVEISGNGYDAQYIIKRDDWDIRGMDISNDLLYVLNYDYTIGGNYLSKFDLQGNLVTTDPFNYDGWSIAIYNNYLYTVSLGDDLIRYHLSEKTYEVLYEDIEMDIESINVIGNLFYYSDYQKKVICFLPLSDILN